MVNGDLASVAKTGMCTYNRVVAPTSTRGSMLECVYVRTHCVEHLKTQQYWLGNQLAFSPHAVL